MDRLGYRATMVSIAIMVIASLLLFQFFQRGMSNLWLGLAIHPEVQRTLELAAEDQKALAKLDAARAEDYRRRFERIQDLRRNFFILEDRRREVTFYYEVALWSLFGLILLGSALVQWQTSRRVALRIESLRHPLEDLADGRTDIHVADHGHDPIGRVARMIEKTSRVLARQKEQLRYLRHLSAWQEASRRHAHEIRTPLTAARLEADRLDQIAQAAGEDLRHPLRAGIHSLIEELDGIKRFTQDFTAFARMRRPDLKALPIEKFLTEFISLFANAWPELTLRRQGPRTAIIAEFDPEMIRQVLVNLCNNSAKSINSGNGTVTIETQSESGQLTILIADDGPGVPPEIADRLFEPYATTRSIGDGMGLGLAISRKIMLDHGGDLELLRTSSNGATFRMILPGAEPLT